MNFFNKWNLWFELWSYRQRWLKGAQLRNERHPAFQAHRPVDWRSYAGQPAKRR